MESRWLSIVVPLSRSCSACNPVSIASSDCSIVFFSTSPTFTRLLLAKTQQQNIIETTWHVGRSATQASTWGKDTKSEAPSGCEQMCDRLAYIFWKSYSRLWKHWAWCLNLLFHGLGDLKVCRRMARWQTGMVRVLRYIHVPSKLAKNLINISDSTIWFSTKLVHSLLHYFNGLSCVVQDLLPLFPFWVFLQAMCIWETRSCPNRSRAVCSAGTVVRQTKASSWGFRKKPRNWRVLTEWYHFEFLKHLETSFIGWISCGAVCSLCHYLFGNDLIMIWLMFFFRNGLEKAKYHQSKAKWLDRESRTATSTTSTTSTYQSWIHQRQGIQLHFLGEIFGTCQL